MRLNFLDQQEILKPLLFLLLHSIVTSPHLCRDIFFSSITSNISSQCFGFSVTGKVSHTHKTTAKIIFREPEHVHLFRCHLFNWQLYPHSTLCRGESQDDWAVPNWNARGRKRSWRNRKPFQIYLELLRKKKYWIYMASRCCGRTVIV